MRIETRDPGKILDGAALVGIVVGFGLLVPAAVSPELRALAFPAFGLLLPSLFYGMR